MSVPASVIHIISVPAMDNRYEHTLWFESEEKQREYFISHTLRTYDQHTYLRRNNSIKVEARAEETNGWHYLALYNGVGGKYYYYFINHVNYINDSTVELVIEMDVIQTYMFNWSLGQCFVERTHVTSDKLGEHTIEEGLETGPLVDCKVTKYSFNDLCILVLTAVDSDVNSAYSNVYDGVFSGLRIYAVDLADYKDFGTYLDHLSTTGKIDAIVNMWMYPKSLVRIQGEWSSDSLLKTVIGRAVTVETEIDNSFAVPGKFQGYDPDNRKLYAYPYSMIYVTNNMGGSAVIRNERFNDPEEAGHTFKMFGALSADSGVKCVPKKYNGNIEAYDNGLTLGSFPTCGWDSDTYKVWLAQNQNSQDLAIQQAKITAGAGALMAVGSVATGNVMGAMGGLGTAYHALTQVQNIMAQRADMEVQPPQARGNQSSNINLANGIHGFTFYHKTITAEYARAIDDYFNRYGYKVNRVMVPSLKNREKFTYVKTVGCTVAGNVPAEDRVKIGNIFDNGITFWADPLVVGYYGNNPI